jgi:hypothetical protein
MSGGVGLCTRYYSISPQFFVVVMHIFFFHVSGFRTAFPTPYPVSTCIAVRFAMETTVTDTYTKNNYRRCVGEYEKNEFKIKNKGFRKRSLFLHT